MMMINYRKNDADDEENGKVRARLHRLCRGETNHDDDDDDGDDDGDDDDDDDEDEENGKVQARLHRLCRGETNQRALSAMASLSHEAP